MTEERFYHFYYPDIKEPITILAPNKMTARHILSVQQLPAKYAGLQYDEEKTSQPLPGVSTMMDGDRKLVWVGKNASPTGWIEADED